MIIGYARVSTKEQCLDLQTQSLKDAGSQDAGISGSVANRPELEKAFKALDPGAISRECRFRHSAIDCFRPRRRSDRSWRVSSLSAA